MAETNTTVSLQDRDAMDYKTPENDESHDSTDLQENNNYNTEEFLPNNNNEELDPNTEM